MDEMKLTLSTNLMKSLVAKLLAGIVKKSFGIKVDIRINELEMVMVNGKMHIHADVKASTDNEPIMNMIKDNLPSS